MLNIKKLCLNKLNNDSNLPLNLESLKVYFILNKLVNLPLGIKKLYYYYFESKKESILPVNCELICINKFRV